MQFGYLKLHEASGNFIGKIEVDGIIAGQFALAKIEQRDPEKSPSHECLLRLPSGQWVKRGSAWTKRTNGPNPEPFFSITLDHPTMDAPLYVSAFPDEDQPGGADDPENFVIKWSRPRRDKASPKNAPEKVVSNDEVPF